MADRLKLYHKLLPILLVPFCAITALGYGWSAFSTITNRSGLNGTMYSYYHLTRIQFATYTSFVSITALFFIIMYVFFLKSPKHLTKSFWLLLLFAAIVIICEVYLTTRFSGKG